VIRLLKGSPGEKDPEGSYLLGVALIRAGDRAEAPGALKRAVATGGSRRVTVGGKAGSLRAVAASELALLLAEGGQGEEIVRLQEALKDQRGTRVPVAGDDGIPRGENRLGVLLRLAEARVLAQEGREEELRELLTLLSLERGPVPWKGEVRPLEEALGDLRGAGPR